MKTKSHVIILLALLALLTLAACAPQATLTELAAEVSTQVATEPVVIEPPVPTETPTDVPRVCAQLLTPENEAQVPAVGKVVFSWEPMNGAGLYVLHITLPSGEIVSFDTTQTNKARYMEAFGMGGEYQWNVKALAEDGSQICTSAIFTFTKSQRDDGDTGGGGNDSGNPPPPPPPPGPH